MLELPFRNPKDVNPRLAEKIIERICREAGLIQTMKSPLSAFPGSIHWHYKKKGETGTLELTFWPAKNRLWAQVQSGRRADWIFEELPGLRRSIEAALRASAGKRTLVRLDPSAARGIGSEPRAGVKGR